MLRVLAALATFLLAAAAEGCARSSAEPASRQPSEVPAPWAPRSAAPPSPAPAARHAASPPALDPGEEITPEELETIPEPVPASPGAGTLPTPRAGLKTAQGASQADSAKAGKGLTAGTALWRVQILATQDRDLADRTAGEASRLLGVKARVVHEDRVGPLRLGRDHPRERLGVGEARAARREWCVESGQPAPVRHPVCGRNLRGAQPPREVGAAREEHCRWIHECAARERAVFEHRGAERVVGIRRR